MSAYWPQPEPARSRKPAAVRAVVSPAPKPPTPAAGSSPRATAKPTGRPRKFATDAARQADYRRRRKESKADG